MENRDDRVEQVTPSQSDYEPPKKAGGVQRFMPLILPVVVVGMLLATGLGSQYAAYVTKADFELNLKSVMAEVDRAKAAATDAAGKATSAVQDVNSLKTNTGQYATQSSVAAVQATVNELKGNIPNTSSFTAQVNTLSSKVESLTKQVSEKDATITNLQSQITTLQTQVNKLNTTQTGTNGGGTLPTGQVSVVAKPNPWGTTILGFVDPLPANTTRTQSFTVEVNNNSGKTINKMQFAVGLQLADGNGNALTTLPTGAALTMNTPGLLTTWQLQPVGGGVYGFSNPISTAFGGIGNVSQAQGVSTYTFSVTLSAGATEVPPLNIYYGVKLVSYE